jgi:hypothetical protein
VRYAAVNHAIANEISNLQRWRFQANESNVEELLQPHLISLENKLVTVFIRLFVAMIIT